MDASEFGGTRPEAPVDSHHGWTRTAHTPSSWVADVRSVTPDHPVVRHPWGCRFPKRPCYSPHPMASLSRRGPRPAPRPHVLSHSTDFDAPPPTTAKHLAQFRGYAPYKVPGSGVRPPYPKMPARLFPPIPRGCPADPPKLYSSLRWRTLGPSARGHRCLASQNAIRQATQLSWALSIGETGVGARKTKFASAAGSAIHPFRCLAPVGRSSPRPRPRRPS
jgi:hypothetical protein